MKHLEQLEKEKFGRGGEFRGVMFHIITSQQEDEEILRQLQEAVDFSGVDLFKLGHNPSRKERITRDKHK